MVVAFLDAQRLLALAAGRGEAPSLAEWPVVVAAVAVFALVAGRLLVASGLTRFESALVALVAPLSVFIDLPAGEASPGVALAVNVAGGVIPFAIALKVLWERRVSGGLLLFVMGVSTVVCYLSSEVVASRGVLLHYRLPALVAGAVCAALWFRSSGAAGAAAYAVGAVGVVLGADVVRLTELARAGSASRIVVGGAGLLDGIYLVALLSAGVAAALSLLLRWVVDLRAPTKMTAG